MREPDTILVVQTAFPGDVVLTLPLVQVLKRNLPSAQIDFLTTPRSAGLLAGHPSLRRVISFDKRGGDAGIRGIVRFASLIRRNRYDVAFVPHRSLRSALLVSFGRVKTRVGFDRSAGKMLFNHVVRYDPHLHEVERNLSLLQILRMTVPQRELPSLYPSDADKAIVDGFIDEARTGRREQCLAIAPGTVWNTKRWLKERFAELTARLVAEGWEVFLVGGPEDADLCREIAGDHPSNAIHIVAGNLTLLQSAELIRRCRLLVCNDSAPMHLAVAMRTPVVAIFGATIPGFGFAPIGSDDVVVEVQGLSCRPCSIHGGDTCPIRTFDCMNKISTDAVYGRIMELVNKRKVQRV